MLYIAYAIYAIYAIYGIMLNMFVFAGIDDIILWIYHDHVQKMEVMDAVKWTISGLWTH